jgi:hypothetical protein
MQQHCRNRVWRVYDMIEMQEIIHSIDNGQLHPESTYCTSNSVKGGLDQVSSVGPATEQQSFLDTKCCRTQR